MPPPQDADTELTSSYGNQQYDTQTEHTYTTRLALRPTPKPWDAGTKTGKTTVKWGCTYCSTWMADYCSLTMGRSVGSWGYDGNT